MMTPERLRARREDRQKAEKRRADINYKIAENKAKDAIERRHEEDHQAFLRQLRERDLARIEREKAQEKKKMEVARMVFLKFGSIVSGIAGLIILYWVIKS